MLHEQYIQLNFFNKVFVQIKPFDWHFFFKRNVTNRGDRDDQCVSILCFELYFKTLSKQGKEGKEYRKKLRESGQWNPERI